MTNPYQQAHERYRSIDAETNIENVSPHEQVNMLFEGARTNIAIAQGNVKRKEIAKKGEHISKAISIIEGLKIGLDHKNGGEIAENLDRLYDYIQHILLKANLNNDVELLNQANKLLSEIHLAWQEIKLEPAEVS